MREIRSYGSVRGVAGDRYPYRDSYFLFAALGFALGEYIVRSDDSVLSRTSATQPLHVAHASVESCERWLGRSEHNRA